MAFLGQKLISATGEVLSSNLNLSKPLFIYFSASWCPPCRGFTPKLVDFYTSHKKAKKDLEVVLITLDETESAFNSYFSKMPWLSVPFNEKKIIRNLSTKYSMTTIPLLVLVNKHGDLISDECRHTIEGQPSTAYDLFVKMLDMNDGKNKV